MLLAPATGFRASFLCPLPYCDRPTAHPVADQNCVHFLVMSAPSFGRDFYYSPINSRCNLNCRGIVCLSKSEATRKHFRPGEGGLWKRKPAASCKDDDNINSAADGILSLQQLASLAVALRPARSGVLLLPYIPERRGGGGGGPLRRSHAKKRGGG